MNSFSFTFSNIIVIISKVWHAVKQIHIGKFMTSLSLSLRQSVLGVVVLVAKLRQN